jgi:hypothetical protein
MNAFGCRRSDAENPRQGGCVSRVLAHDAKRGCSKPRRGIRLEEVRSAVDRVNRLPPLK